MSGMLDLIDKYPSLTIATTSHSNGWIVSKDIDGMGCHCVFPKNKKGEFYESFLKEFNEALSIHEIPSGYMFYGTSESKVNAAYKVYREIFRDLNKIFNTHKCDWDTAFDDYRKKVISPNDILNNINYLKDLLDLNSIDISQVDCVMAAEEILLEIQPVQNRLQIIENIRVCQTIGEFEYLYRQLQSTFVGFIPYEYSSYIDGLNIKRKLSNRPPIIHDKSREVEVLEKLVADFSNRIEKLEATNAGLASNILDLTKLLQPVQNTKILVGNLANQAKSALKIHKKKDAGYEK